MMTLIIIAFSISCQALRLASNNKKDFPGEQQQQMMWEKDVPDEKEVNLDEPFFSKVFMDEVESKEAVFEDKLVKRFEPSPHLVKEWKASAKKQNIQSELIPEECTNEVRSTKFKNEMCVDPWYKTRDCSKGFEIPGYRLGDWFHGIIFRDPTFAHFFPNSVGEVYYARKNKNHDYDLLNKIVDDPLYKDFERPEEDMLVVHVRGGDVALHWKKEDHGFYGHEAKFYDRKAAKAANLSLSKVTIVTGDHMLEQTAALWPEDDPRLLTGNFTQPENDKKKERSTKKQIDERIGREKKRAKQHQQDLARAKAQIDQHIQTITDIFKNRSFTVNVRRNMNADCDFIYMTHAKYFVRSGGGFSEITSKLVEMHGNQNM